MSQDHQLIIFYGGKTMYNTKPQPNWRLHFPNETVAKNAYLELEEMLPTVRVTLCRDLVFVHSVERSVEGIVLAVSAKCDAVATKNP